MNDLEGYSRVTHFIAGYLLTVTPYPKCSLFGAVVGAKSVKFHQDLSRQKTRVPRQRAELSFAVTSLAVLINL